MRSLRKRTIVTASALLLMLTAAGTARAQFAVPGFAGQPAIGSYGPGGGGAFAYGLTPLGYGPFGCLGCGVPFTINPAIEPAYGPGAAPGARTAHAYQSLSGAISLVPGWDRPSRRARRRH